MDSPVGLRDYPLVMIKKIDGKGTCVKLRLQNRMKIVNNSFNDLKEFENIPHIDSRYWFNCWVHLILDC